MIKSKNIETTIKSYNKTAEAYSERTLKINTEKQINQFLSYLPEKSSILDVGCGPGRDAKIFSEKDYNVTGIDLSYKFLKIAIEYSPKARFTHMDILNMSFPNNYFDGLWAMSSLMHLEKNRFLNALRECEKILKNKGAFYLSLKRGEGEGLEPDKRYDGVEKYFAYYQDDEVKEILNKTNFEIIDFYGNATADKSYATNPWMNIFVKKAK